jgi:carbamoyl-phosphate synthase small subunit
VCVFEENFFSKTPIKTILFAQQFPYNMNQEQRPANLLLADGTVLDGFAFGKIGTTAGEICFYTGMTGYQEVFTDPSYAGQIIIMYNVHIGNYGVKCCDTESNSIKI